MKKRYSWIPFFNKKPKVGLVFGGGGARGMALIGVVKALEENNLNFDFVAGTSAGSIVGALYSYGMKSEEMAKRAKTINIKDVRKNKVPLMPSRADGIADIIRNNIGDIDFSDLKLPFCAVATDIVTGDEVHITKGNVATAISASCCVPGLFYPVKIDNYVLFDGGLLNNIPTNIPKLYGCDVVIAIDANSSRGQGTTSQKYLDQVTASIRIMMKSSSLKGYINADLMIKPDLKRFKSTSLEGIDEMIEEGYNATIYKMNEIKKLMGIRTKRIKTRKASGRITAKNKLII